MAADGCRGDAEVALGGEAEEVELHLGGGLARHAALLQEGAEGDLGGVRLGLLHHGVEEAGVACAASPPGELVVDEVAEEPGVVLVRCTAAARHVVAMGREERVEHVREGAARTVLVRADPEGVVALVPAEGVAHREEARVDESAPLERGVATRAEEVEPPRLQARERVRLPVRLVRELLLVDLVVDAPLRALAPVSAVGYVVHAHEHHPASERIDRPPAAVGTLHHAEEARGVLLDLWGEAVGRIRRKGFRRLRAGTGFLTCGIERGEASAEPAVRVKCGTSARDGGGRGAIYCARSSRRKRESPDEEELAGRVAHLALDARAVRKEREGVCLAVAPRTVLPETLLLQLVRDLREPRAIARLAQFEEMSAGVPLVVRRRLHEGEVPIVAFVVDERDAERGPAVRAGGRGRDRSGHLDLRGARRGLVHGESAAGPARNCVVAERPREGVGVPLLKGDGKRGGAGNRARQGARQDKQMFFHAPIIPYSPCG